MLYIVLYFGIGLALGLLVVLTLQLGRSKIEGSDSELRKHKAQVLSILRIVFLWPLVLASVVYNHKWASQRFKYWMEKKE